MLYSFLLNFLNADAVCKVIAKCIAKLLETASRKGGDAWDKAKAIIKQVHVWCGLFIEVYDDDNLTEDEEKKIADAIKNQTNIEKIVDIIKK